MADEDNLNLSELDTSEAPATTESDDDLSNMTVELPERDTQLASIQDLEAVYDIPVQVSAVLGKSSMQVSQILKLGRGAVVELDRKVGEAVDIYINNRLVARGEVVVVEERLGVTMTEIIKTDQS
jgi:flagellar motor switch protein FliN/FliY